MNSVAPDSLENQAVAPDEQDHQAQFKFDGAWKPAQDPSEIGPTNFQVLQNIRYAKGAPHLEGVSGYTKINTTAITTYTTIKNGIQLKNDFGTTKSYVLVQAEDSSGNTRVYKNTTAIPSAGNFTATQVHSDASGAGLGRFSEAPNGNVIYCNGKENYIWAGDYMPIGALFLCDDSALANPRNYTEAVKDNLSAAGHKFTVAAATTDYFLLMTRRPISGVHFTVSDANATASSLTANVYTTAGWAAVAAASDGTADGGASLAQSGTYSFTSTVDDAVPFHFEGLYMYAYRFVLSAGSAGISHITVNAPWQEVIDLWDGIPRQPYHFAVSRSGKYDDRTAHVYSASDMDTPIGAELDGLTTSDDIIVMFEERMAAVRFTMLGSLVNDEAATLTAKYWDGDSWADLTETDGTSDGTDTFSQSGLVSWIVPAHTLEFPKTIQGKTGYAYQFTVSATLTGTYDDSTDSVFVDVVTGIPAQYQIPPFKFPSEFKNRVLLCGYIDGDEGNRVDYGPANYANAFNGNESSMGGVQSLYFGDSDPLTCGVSLYNRYGSSTFEVWLAFKNTKTYQLKGSSPDPESDPWQIDKVSNNIGCPAPLTLVTAELGFEVSEAAKRNIAIWVSASGPYAYDGAILYPIKGIENYFDPNNSECINWSYIDTSTAWYDSVYHEYNLIIPTGGATAPNTWLVLDLKRQEWFEKTTGAASMVRCGFEVVDSNGAQYIYGGTATGFMMRLEYGTSWSGTGITQKLVTGDFYPSENVWHKTLLRRLKLVAKKISEAHTVTILYRKDTDPTDAVGLVWDDCDAFTWEDCTAYTWEEASVSTMSLTSDNPDRLLRKTINTNYLAWTHAVGFEVTTTTTNKAFQPIGFGFEYAVIRDYI